jgi:hypothetical protein
MYIAPVGFHIIHIFLFRKKRLFHCVRPNGVVAGMQPLPPVFDGFGEFKPSPMVTRIQTYFLHRGLRRSKVKRIARGGRVRFEANPA